MPQPPRQTTRKDDVRRKIRRAISSCRDEGGEPVDVLEVIADAFEAILTGMNGGRSVPRNGNGHDPYAPDPYAPYGAPDPYEGEHPNGPPNGNGPGKPPKA